VKWEELAEQPCAVARFLSVMGDRWSLLILSDAFLGVRRFDTFQKRLGISRTILKQRLDTLVEAGVLDRAAYRERPLRHEYRLTSKGVDLHPVIHAMSNWANTHCADEAGAPILFRHRSCGRDFETRPHCSECNEPVAAWEVEARARPDRPGAPPVVRGPMAEGGA